MSVQGFYIRSLRHRAFYTAAAAAFGLLLLYICTRPHSVMERWHYPDISDLFDATNHFAGFTFFNFLVLSTILSAQACSDAACRPARKKRTAALLLAVGLTWGFVCELLQLFIPSRSFQFVDVAANTLPSVLVFYIFKMKMK